MTKSKLKSPVDRSNSAYGKKINLLYKQLYHFQNLALKRKRHITTYHDFIDKLKKDGRITKDELQLYFTKYEKN